MNWTDFPFGRQDSALRLTANIQTTGFIYERFFLYPIIIIICAASSHWPESTEQRGGVDEIYPAKNDGWCRIMS
jgi:hypothetical protein